MATLHRVDLLSAELTVSIHATLAGGDSAIASSTNQAGSFYPRHPRGWRLVGMTSSVILKTFLSTPPSRVATLQLAANGIMVNSVSIHATLAGGDYIGLTYAKDKYRFYPRHPRGWRQKHNAIRLHFLLVSIHATLAGGDAKYGGLQRTNKWFLSTPPSRVATI